MHTTLAQLTDDALIDSLRGLSARSHEIEADIIRLGASLGVDYALTHSCYSPAADGAACGRCDSCQLRRAGFEAAGILDPTWYAAPE